MYEHALKFLDQFLKEARARRVRLRHRLDAQSVVWHWRKLPDDLPLLGLPFPECSNGVEAENGHEGWDAFARRVNELTTSDGWNRKQIAPKLKVEGMAKQARTAVLADADNWADSVKNIFTGQHVFFINRDKVRSWIDESPEDALQALKASWTEGSLSEEQRIRAFCERFPEEIISGKGSRLTVAATLLAPFGAKQFPPFSKTSMIMHTSRPDTTRPSRTQMKPRYMSMPLASLTVSLRWRGRMGWTCNIASTRLQWCGTLSDSLPRISTQPIEPKSLHALAEELLLPPNFLEEICTLLEDKRQVIFQGPPGTGKTYVAQELAKHLAESESGERVTPVQFHPSYAYEDFVRGFRPTLKEGQAGFELRDGPLLRAAQKARDEPGTMHFLLIDEINRGNLAKLFGELYFLLEYRDKPINMQYQKDNEKDFSLPENLYIIGTMNTADRSIALVDLALRRRFYFIEFHPDNEPVKSVLRKWLRKMERQDAHSMEWVADIVDKANELLKDDRHAAIGPSYFMKNDLTKEDVRRIWQHSVLPYIEERLFGDVDRVKQFRLKTLCKQVAPTITWDDDGQN